MDKKIFFAVAAGLIVVIFFLVIVIMVVQQKKTDLANPIPTPTTIPTPTLIADERPTIEPTAAEKEPLTVLGTIPQDKAINVPIDTPITITFNHGFQLKDFIFAITPDIMSFSNMLENQDKMQAYIVPNKHLLPNTMYTFKVNTLTQLPKTFTFTTGEATGAAQLKFH